MESNNKQTELIRFPGLKTKLIKKYGRVVADKQMKKLEIFLAINVSITGRSCTSTKMPDIN